MHGTMQETPVLSRERGQRHQADHEEDRLSPGCLWFAATGGFLHAPPPLVETPTLWAHLSRKDRKGIGNKELRQAQHSEQALLEQ